MDIVYDQDCDSLTAELSRTYAMQRADNPIGSLSELIILAQ